MSTSALINDEPGDVYYCLKCEEIVGNTPGDHRGDVHDGEYRVGTLFGMGDYIHPIGGTNRRGDRITRPRNECGVMPHMWTEVDGRDTCCNCGAVAIPDEVVEQYSEGYA